MNQTVGIISTTPVETEGEEGEESSGQLELRSGEVTTQLHAQRIDRALVDLAPEFSRSYLQQLLEAGAVTVNDLKVHKASQRVKAGDRLVVELRPTPQSQAFKAEAIPLRIVYEDGHILVINKPPGLVVHPAPGNWSGTLLNGLLAHDPDSNLMPRAGIVHRLDKDTSGLMVVARTRPAMDALVKAIAAREVSRQYLALAHGSWCGPSEVTVNTPVGRDPRNRLRMAVVDLQSSAGKSARTDIYLLKKAAEFCFVRCVLHTGRTHQIRVHMASIGHPLVADLVYGGAVVLPMQRQALHACRLAFLHPVTGMEMVFEAPIAEDFAALLDSLTLSYNEESRPLGH